MTDIIGTPFPIKYVWDKTKVFEFQNTFNQECIQNLIEDLVSYEEELSDGYVDKMVNKLNNIYNKVAEISLKKVVHSSKKKTKVWFNKNLQSLKKHVMYLSGMLQKYPNCTEIRGSFFKTLKFYNKERKRKRREFKQMMLDRLDLLRDNNPKEYWKLLQSMKQDETNSSNIGLEEWRIYLLDLSCTDNNFEV